MFFNLLFYTVSHNEQGSLSYMVSVMESDFGIQIKKQSLHERFTERSVNYVKTVLSEILSEYLFILYPKELVLPNFKSIRIKDSTKFKVPSTLSDKYKCCGVKEEDSSNGSISIQFEYDLRSGKVMDLNITSGTRNDRTDAEETSENISIGDFMIRDLGYFSTKVLKKWMNNGAYFLSRLDSGTLVYDVHGEQICFEKIRNFMQKRNITEKEILVYVGKETRLPVRLILQLVPEHVYEKRILEKTKKSKGQGRGQLKKETKNRCPDFVIFTL